MKTKLVSFLIAPAVVCSAQVFSLAQETPNSVPATAENAPSSGKKIVLELPDLPSVENVKIKIFGTLQSQYLYATASGAGASDQNGFSVRRSILGVSAEVGDGWGAKISYEFDSGSDGGSPDNGYIDTAIISKKIDEMAGTLTVGHRKPNFMLEEYSSSSKFLCLERSINSNFVSGNTYVRGLAGSHIGIFWDGKIADEIDYGFSLTNAVAKDYDKRSNDLAATANIAWTTALGSDDTKLSLGLNVTMNFGDDGTTPDSSEKSPLTNAGTVYGIEPYAKLTSGGLTTIADFYFIDGTNSAKIDPVYGLALTAAYRFEYGFEPAVRFTYLNTDSGAVNANIQNRVPDSGGHNNATTYYAGVNYYFNKYVKLAAGYEYGHYFGGGTTRSADSGAFRTMLQVAF